jgi:hypothetical protein
MLARLLAVSTLAAAPLLAMGPADAAPVVKIIKVYYDSPGADTRTNTSINGEYVVVKNMTTTTRVITGWTVRDAAGHIYKFGTFSLGGGKTVTLYTGKGTNSSTRRYWGQTNYVWNNDKDTASLRNASGSLIQTCSYNSTAVDYKTC